MTELHFVKPSAKQNNSEEEVTRHLYVCGLGSALGSTVETVATIFAPYGALDTSQAWGAIDLVPDKRFCFVSFVHKESAQRALESLRASSRGGNSDIRLLVKYAEENKGTRIKAPPEPEDTALSEDLVVPGLHIVENFIDEQEETDLMAVFGAEDAEWEDGISRRVQHFGFPFNYRTLMLDYNRPVQPIPKSCTPLIERMSDLMGSKAGALPLSQLTVNEYEPGQGIACHIDTFNCFGPDIYILSMSGGITMSLTHRSSMEVVEDGASQTADGADSPDAACDTAAPGNGVETRRKKHIWLPRRSLLILSGEARYEWGHCISSRMQDKVNGVLIPRSKRVSLTFRQAFRPNDPPKVLAASHVELDHVFRVYDDIAVHWNHTRGKRKVHWHRVKTFLEALPPGSMLADIGSGDGKYFGLNPGVVCIGCDRSWQLLQVSKQPNFETFCCDVVALPLQSNAFDATICVAVLHHLASRDRRVAAIRELLRITRPGGTILIQAWALEQEENSRLLFPEQDVLVPWRLQPRFMQQSGTGTDSSGTEALLSTATTASPTISPEGSCEHVETDGQGALVYKRYCHVYRRGEIEDICSYVPGAVVVDSSWDKGNWVVEIRKALTSVEDTLPINPHKYACPEFVKRAEAAVLKTANAVTDASVLRVVMPDNRATKKASNKAIGDDIM